MLVLARPSPVAVLHTSGPASAFAVTAPAIYAAPPVGGNFPRVRFPPPLSFCLRSSLRRGDVLQCPSVRLCRGLRIRDLIRRRGRELSPIPERRRQILLRRAVLPRARRSHAGCRGVV